jgi:uncharacterized membrane protein
MRLLKRLARGDPRLGRVEAFSDGVFAIVVTLLVLDLKVPTVHDRGSAGELGRQLIDLVPKFFSWLISFMIVCKFWLNHHHLLSFARHATYGMVWLNSIFLMLQSFIPFPTALMGEYPMNSLAVTLFGVVMAINTLLFIALQSYIMRNLIKPEMIDAQVPHLTLKSFVGVISYLLGAAATWFNLHLAFILYALTPLFFITPPRVQSRPVGQSFAKQ